VVDERPLPTARIIQVDVFNAEGELPRNLSDVSERAKDIQYASKTRFNIEQITELGELTAASYRLLSRLPPGLRSDPDAKKLAAACVKKSWLIIRLINKRPSRPVFGRDTHGELVVAVLVVFER
jgi:NTE family protein